MAKEARALAERRRGAENRKKGAVYLVVVVGVDALALALVFAQR